MSLDLNKINSCICVLSITILLIMLYNVNYNKIETGFHIYTAELCRCTINNTHFFFTVSLQALLLLGLHKKILLFNNVGGWQTGKSN